MDETFISFYLKVNRIHIFVKALREIGCPSRICFMIGDQGNTLLLAPYTKRDFKSHSVPHDVYVGRDCMEISSLKLCRIIAKLHGWETNHSYRVPGTIYEDQSIVMFDLTNAMMIRQINS